MQLSGRPPLSRLAPMPPEALTLLAVVIFGAGMLTYHLALGGRRHD